MIIALWRCSVRIPQNILDWLLEKSDPSVQYRTLRELLDREENDSDVVEANPYQF